MADQDLYLKHRPTTLDEVIGQSSAVSQIQKLHAQKKIPHALLFTGPSGTGKTTLARIVRSLLGCSEVDFVEVNAAKERGIDMVRDLASQCRAMPLAGDARVYLIDEAQSLTSDGQSALLKILEDTPKHVYFMLATTDPQKLKQTIRTRTTQIQCTSLKDSDIAKLVKTVVAAEDWGDRIPGAVLKRIVKVSQGSARQALVILNQVAELGTEEEQIKAVDASDWEADAISLVRALMRKSTWNEIAGIINNLKSDENFEGLRRLILAYAVKVALNPKGQDSLQKAIDLIDEFRDNYYDTGKAGLVLNCWNMVNR